MRKNRKLKIIITNPTNLKPSNKSLEPMPILWFGDKNAYKKSGLKIVTVGLNPSDREFRGNDNQQPSTKLRFPSFKGTMESLETALNEYFEKNP